VDLGTLRGTLQLDDSPFDKVLDKSQEKVRNWGSTSAKIAVGAGLAIGGAIAGSLAGAMNLQPARNKLRAQLNLSAKDSAKVGQVAGRLFGNAYGDSLGQVNDAVKSVGNNMVSLKRTSSTELEGITAKVLDVAHAFDQDLNKVTGAAGQLMRTGLAKNATQAMDIITRGLQSPANKADDLLDTFNEYGTQFRKLGLSGPKALGLINQAVEAGARDSDVAADALKEFSIRAIDGSKLTAQGFKGLGLDAKKMAGEISKGGPAAEKALGTTLEKLRGIKDPAKQAQLATALFGTQAEDLGAALFNMVPARAVKDVGKLAGAATDMGKKLNDNASSNIESFKRKAQLAFVDTIGGRILPAVTKFTAYMATNFGPALKASAQWIQRNQAWLKPLAVALGVMAGIILVVVAAMRVWAAVQAILNVVMAANPIGIVIILIAGLVAGLIYAYKHSQKFRDIVQGAMRGVGAAFTWLVAAGKVALHGIVVAVNWVIAAARSVLTWLKGHWRTIVFFIGGPVGIVVLLITKYWSQITGAFRAAARWVGSVFKAGWALVRKFIIDPVLAAWNWLVATSRRIRALFGALISYVVGPFARGWARIQDLMRGPIDRAKTAISRIIDGVKRIFSDGVKRIGEIWAGIQEKARKPVSFIINTVINKGLLGGYNWVAGKLGLNKIAPVKIKGFYGGGPTGGGVSDRQIAGVTHANEHVVTAAETRAAGGHGTWERIRAMARAGALRGFFLGGRAPVPGPWHRHSGYSWARWAGDNPGPVGRPVHAWKSGTIAAIRLLRSSYGRHIIENAAGARAYYAHLLSTSVRPGQHVNAGQVIAHTGGRRGALGSGNSTGPHLHFEIRGGSAAISSAGGTILAAAAAKPSWLGKFSSAVTLLKSKIKGGLADLKSLGSSPWANVVKAVPNKLVDAMIEKVKTSWSSFLSNAPGSAANAGFTNTGGGSNRAIGLRMMQQRWPAGQWGALNNLWTRESGWRTTAKNPSSGAYGIPQALPGSKMASAGSDWRTNPATQIKWGLGYIASRYGSPAGAWAHSQRTGWYANGTASAAPGYGWTSEKGAELVVNPQLRKYGGGERVFNAGETKKMLGGLGAGVTQYNNFPATMDPQTAAEAAGGRLAVMLRANGW
jgi:phage-related minor tail protein/murein DD-endopeptidase MepM/ murein hydrolase activator NlpD